MARIPVTRHGLDLAKLQRIAFLTLPNYSMIAFTNALEACRMANYVSGRAAYEWQVVTLDGKPAMASNGLSVSPGGMLDMDELPDLLLVCGGISVRHAVSRELKDLLRRVARRGVAMGALCTGAFALAEAGLLEGRTCAIHWENLSSIREEFSGINFVDDLYVIDGDRLTCTGGVAPLDMMLALIEKRLGPVLARKVSAQFILERIRHAEHPQKPQTGKAGGIRHPALGRALKLMAATIEAPLEINRIAQASGVSSRQLERLFKQETGHSPVDHYHELRLERARELLRQTRMSVTDVSLACGFLSGAHFSTAYSRRFGHSPKAERAVAGAA
ncbi:MAG: GlxA family transcriptional regulator [Parvibaculaceae bacterium]|nr:GlxA family transcriptional regulator [Parvibaculaceae bacterium]